ncbi:hypothetical protein IJ118_01000 [Candidatus Saccharibacteria bacterium]|nr:hypothetical protein [Candidatus Saccharibacteria bacterium]
MRKDAGRPSTKFLVWGIVVAVICGLAFAGVIVSMVTADGSGLADLYGRNTTTKVTADLQAEVPEIPETPEIPEIPAEVPVETQYAWNFRHDAVLRDNIKENDDYFGNAIIDEIIMEKVNAGELRLRDINWSDPESLVQLVTVDEYLTKVVELMAYDPALGAAWMGAYDAENHTRILGEPSSELKDHPDTRMLLLNQQKDKWVQDRDDYWSHLRAFVSALEDADNVYLTYKSKGLTDQMYMDSHTVDGTPDIIIMESATESGICLIVENYIKGTTTTARNIFRDDCGGQPANIAEAMEVVPQANPNKSTPPPATTPPVGGSDGAGGGGPANPDNNGSGGGGPANPDNNGFGGGGPANPDQNGTGGGGPANPDQTPQESPKDVNRGTPISTIGVNDSPGVENDPFTGTGVGGMYSSVEVNDPAPEYNRSGFVTEYPVYDHSQAVNEGYHDQGTPAGGSNTPTYQPPKAPDAFDNPGQNGNGNGYGGADVATPVKPPTELEGVPSYDPSHDKTEIEAPPL